MTRPKFATAREFKVKTPLERALSRTTLDFKQTMRLLKRRERRLLHIHVPFKKVRDVSGS